MNVLIRATRDHLHQTSLFFFFPTCSADDMKWEKQPHGSHMSTLKMTVFCLFTFQSVS